MKAKVVNDLMQDPLLYIEFEDIPDRILFDCGYMFGLTLREIQKISSVFVSHTHFDHFMGFDHLLRMCIEQDRTVEFYGPAGFINQIVGKLAGYSWNLCENLGLNFKCFEIAPPFIKSTLLKAKNAFKIENIEEKEFESCIKKGKGYSVHTAIMDHKIPSLAFSIKEDDYLKVNSTLFEKFSIKPGPWLGSLIKKVENKEELSENIEFENGISYTEEFLAENLLYLEKGKKVSYIVDTAFTENTFKDGVELIKDSDELYCECAFLNSDIEKAHNTFHLTASQAGKFANHGHVKKLFPIHLSKRYNGIYRDIFEEAMNEFPNVFNAYKKKK